MNILYKSIFFIISIILVIGCTSKSKTVNKDSSNDPVLHEIEAMDYNLRLNSFALSLYRQILEKEDDNFVISPFSISTALAMAYGGAGGETKNEISKTMFFNPDIKRFHQDFSNHVKMIDSLSGDDMELSIANGMWLQHDYPFLEDYIITIKKFYGSLLHKADFVLSHENERKNINEWVAKQTNDRIDELIAGGILDEDTRLVLVNAIYFLSKWLHQFEKELTIEREFYLDSEIEVKVPFMRKEESYYYYADEYAQVLRIPYEGNNFSMIIVLPKKDMQLAEFELKTDIELYERYFNSLNRQRVQLFLPKFKIRYKANLKELLVQMGMPLAFTDRADFSSLTSADDLKIDEVIHQAFIEVDEKGTEAAAATAVTMMLKSARPVDDKIIFDANRPFKFIIKEDKTNTILFMGRVKNPSI